MIEGEQSLSDEELMQGLDQIKKAVEKRVSIGDIFNLRAVKTERNDLHLHIKTVHDQVFIIEMEKECDDPLLKRIRPSTINVFFVDLMLEQAFTGRKSQRGGSEIR